MIPAISLDYSSQGGDGIVGLGWTLSGLPTITRCPSNLAQDSAHGSVNFDASDHFCMEGQRLVSLGSSSNTSLCTNAVEYRTEIDGFSRVAACGTAGTGPQYFLAWTKSGQLMEFGNTSDSSPNPVKVSGGTLTSVRSWAIDKISDTAGNYLTVKYTNDEVNGQLYPIEIDYTGNTGLTPYNSVRFVYAYKNPGAIVPFYQAGTVSQRTVVLTEIDTCTNVGGTCTYASRYYLNYNTAANGTGFVTQGNQHDELTSVQQCDNSGNCLPPTSFTWQGSRDTLTMTRYTGSGANTTFQGTDYTTTLIPGDFNGDGILDVSPAKATNGSCGFWFGSGDGLTFSDSGINPQYNVWVHEDAGWVEEPSSLCGQQSTIDPLDFDGDGLTDISITYRGDSGFPERYFFHSNGNGFDSESQTFSTGDDRFGDFNGDGRSDIFVNTSSAYTELSNGDGTWTASGSYSGNGSLAKAVIPPDFDGDGCGDVLYLNIHQINFFCSSASPVSVDSTWGSTWAVALGDFNGDGKTDVFVSRAGYDGTPAKLYLSTGTGFAAPISITGTNVTANDWGLYSIYTGDFNGDGKTDLLLVADGVGPHHNYSHHAIWVSTGTGFVLATNTGGSTVSIPYTSDSRDYPGNQVNIRPVVADWNNDGASDIWLQKPSGDEQYYFSYKPELIKTVTNGIGVTTTVTYDRLNQNGTFYSKSSDPSGCTGAWPNVTPKPCTQNIDGPLYVVKQVTSSNGVGGNYTSTYTYAGAKADLMGRGFVGFAQQTITDSQTKIVQTTNYRTDFPYVGLVDSQTKVCPHPTCNSTQDITISSTANTYDNIRKGTANNYYYAVRLRTAVSQSNDIDAGITALPGVETDYGYPVSTSNYWDATTVTVTTTPPGGSADLVKTTTNTYDNTTDNTHWFLSRLRTAYVTTAYTPAGGSPSTITRQSSYQYDPNTGLLTEEVVEPNQSNTSNLKVTTDYGYDAFGNKNSVTVTGSGNPAPPSCETDTQYDTKGRFPVKITNCLMQSETWGTTTAPTYDVRFGLPTSHKGPNLLVTSWGYDGFGHKVSETRPDGTMTQLGYTYCNAVYGGVDGTCPTNGAFLVTATTLGVDGTTQIAPTTRSYYDTLSRALSADVQGFDSKWIRTDTLYDTWGRVSETSRPYFLVGGTPVYSTLTYDDLGRVIKALQPDGGYTSTAYAGLTTTVTVHLIRPDTSWSNLLTRTVKNDLGQVASVNDALTNTTTYTYDALGDLLTTTDPLGNVITNTFDVRGRKTQSTDPDMGTWKYTYDSLGRLVSQKDAKLQITNIIYDQLGRVMERDDPDMTSNWTYDTATHGVGKPAVVTCSGTACAPNGYTRTYYYDSSGRQYKLDYVFNGSIHYYSYTTYSANTGKIATERSFSGYITDNVYNTTGYLSQILDDTSQNAIWTANSRDAEMHLLSATTLNNVTTKQSFDPNSGRIDSISAGLHNDNTQEVANLSFDFDSAGNLVDRLDTHMTGWAQESFCYDKLNRLTYSDTGTTGVACNATGRTAMTYDAAGNLASKGRTGAGTQNYSYTYIYPTPGTSQPHAVSSITTSSGDTINGASSPSYVYDVNGNMTSGANRTITYTSFNKADIVTTSGTNNYEIWYDPDHQRSYQCAPNCTSPSNTTLYLNDGATSAMAERYKVGNQTTWRTYIVADGKLVVERFVPPSGAASMRYFTLDHLGSVAVITDENGAVLTDGSGNLTGRLSYDSWGAMRNLDATADTTCSLPPQQQSTSGGVTRGYTSQEEMPSTCLVNYNARVYDPQIGRFMSADPTIEAPYNPQDLNRYSYVGNNPLSFTDPSGLCFLGCFWKNPIFVAILAVAISILMPAAIVGWGVFAAAAGGSLEALAVIGVAGAIAGAVSAGLTGGNVLKGALFGGMTAFAFAATGALAGDLGLVAAAGQAATAGQIIGNVALHGMVGGLINTAEHQSFLSGFLSAGVGSLGGPLLGQSSGTISTQGVLVSAALGGVASVLGGGKFQNGAITGAFAYVTSNLAERTAQMANGSNSDGNQGLADGPEKCPGESDYACTNIDPRTLKAYTTYTDAYDKLDPISQYSVIAHETVHVGEIDQYVSSHFTGWDRLIDTFDPDWIPDQVHEWMNANSINLEIPAYNAGINYLNAHINDYWGFYSASVKYHIQEQTYILNQLKGGN